MKDKYDRSAKPKEEIIFGVRSQLFFEKRVSIVVGLNNRVRK
ncbi:unnamed protein product [marine sediment metagenome]|uniref:Uncharacterized protein n=1 Tax=marine sediment metagenome TaxID=412755 RepID=X0V947_9ZZZZ